MAPFTYKNADKPAARAYLANGTFPPNITSRRDRDRFAAKWNLTVIRPNGRWYQGQKEIIFQENALAVLADYWRNPANGGSFSGRDKLFKTLQLKFIGFNRSQVAEFVSRQRGHQVHLQRNAPRVVNPLNPSARFEVIQVDQTEFRGLFMLCGLDLYSKYAWVERKNSRFEAADTVRLLQRIKDDCDDLGETWKTLQTDNGTEFVNKAVEDWCEAENVKIVRSLPYRSTSQGAVERFNRTIKTTIAKRMTVLGGQATSAVVQQAVLSYNHSYHSATGKTPAEVIEGAANLRKRQVRPVPDRLMPKIKRGDKVRLSIYSDKDYRKKLKFAKGDEPQWFDEIYEVRSKSKNRNPLAQHAYTLEDAQGHLVGSFPRYLLQRVHDEGDLGVGGVMGMDAADDKKRPKLENPVDEVPPEIRNHGSRTARSEMKALADHSNRAKNPAAPPERAKRQSRPTAKVLEAREAAAPVRRSARRVK